MSGNHTSTPPPLFLKPNTVSSSKKTSYSVLLQTGLCLNSAFYNLILCTVLERHLITPLATLIGSYSSCTSQPLDCEVLWIQDWLFQFASPAQHMALSGMEKTAAIERILTSPTFSVCSSNKCRDGFEYLGLDLADGTSTLALSIHFTSPQQCPPFKPLQILPILQGPGKTLLAYSSEDSQFTQ